MALRQTIELRDMTLQQQKYRPLTGTFTHHGESYQYYQ